MVRKLAIVQGRLSSFVADNYQYFPIHNWREEFRLASAIGFDGIEWVLSDLSNPIFDSQSRDEMTALVNETGVSISSVSLDLFKYKTLNFFSFEQIEWVLKGIESLSRKTKIGRVSFPVEEDSRVFDAKTKKEVIQILKKVMEISNNLKFKICIETDLSPKAANYFLRKNELHNLGLVVDLGNSAANGYDFEQYFQLLAEKIYGIHIKDRSLDCGPSVRFGDGDAEFDKLNQNIMKAVNLNDVTLQSFRTEKDFFADAREAKNFLLNYLNTDI